MVIDFLPAHHLWCLLPPSAREARAAPAPNAHATALWQYQKMEAYMRKNRSGNAIWLSMTFLLVFCLTFPAGAVEKPKDYPDRPVTIMVGFSPGGSSDVGARVVAEALKTVIGQPVVVENKPGAGSQVMLTEFKNNAKPDGYTIALINVPQIQTIVYDPTRKAAFDLPDFQPVANHVQDPGAILVRKDSPFKTLEEFIAAAKANPGNIRVSTTGIGSDDHLAVLDFQRMAGVTFNIVHLRATPEALTATLGGHVDADFDNVGGFLPTAKSEEGRILGVMMDERYPDLPDVPTLKEKGINLISSSTRGYVMPAGTPMEIVRYMEDAFKKAMEDPEHAKRMRTAGLTVKFMDIPTYGAFLESQNSRAKDLIKLYRK
jgi:tripartite-type tricarboxylate transporter receptor subunit TctC